MRPPLGFVLVATLWLLAALTIAASFFALWSQRALTLAQALREDVQGEIDMSSTQANLLYLLTTQSFTIRGLTLPLPPETTYVKGAEIALDDTPYFGHGKAYFALQDLGGLININLASDAVLYRLLGILGVAVEARLPLIEKLRDYVDLDDLHRLNGAESYHYQQRHLPPPANHNLMNPLECRRIMDWAEQPSLWENNALTQLITTSIFFYPNFNTAPAQVLQAVYDFSAEGAERLVEQRKIAAFSRMETVSQVGGKFIDIDPLEVNFLATPFLRMTLWYEGSTSIRQIYLDLTPQGKKPWMLDYHLELKPLPSYTKSLPNHAQFPLSPTTP